MARGARLGSRFAPGASVSRDHVTRWWAAQQGRLHGRMLDVGGYGRPVGRWTVNPEPAAGAHYVCRVQDMEGVGVWDVLMLSEVLEHDPNPVDVLLHSRRLLKPGGTLLVTVPFIFRVHETTTVPDYHRFTPSGLEDACNLAGFEVQRLWALGGFWSVLVDLVKQAVSLSRWPALAWLLAPVQWLLVERIEPRCGAWAYQWSTGWGVHAIAR